MKYRGFEEKAKSKMTKYPKIGLSEMIDSPNGLIKMSATSIYNDLTLSPEGVKGAEAISLACGNEKKLTACRNDLFFRVLCFSMN